MCKLPVYSVYYLIGVMVERSGGDVMAMTNNSWATAYQSWQRAVKFVWRNIYFLINNMNTIGERFGLPNPIQTIPAENKPKVIPHWETCFPSNLWKSAFCTDKTPYFNISCTIADSFYQINSDFICIILFCWSHRISLPLRSWTQICKICWPKMNFFHRGHLYFCFPENEMFTEVVGFQSPLVFIKNQIHNRW